MSNRIEYEKILNESQLSAVKASDGPIIVIAGAGSGKTRTLVYRVAWLIETGVLPERILLLTFTRKASKEMLERAANLTDERCKNVAGGTFHSLARQVLREKAEWVGFSPSFTIMDRSDMEEAVRSLVSEAVGGDSPIRFPKSSTITNIFSKTANMEKPLSEIMEMEYPQFLPILPELKQLYTIYSNYKQKNNLMDFDDLLLFFRRLLEENEEIRINLSNRYRYIMVDEYQDTNTIQADIIRYLGFYHNNVMVVGDDSQSIYSFRGANFKNMFDFSVNFPETKVIKLEENYRSTQPILTMTNALMDQATQKYTKCLFTRRKGKDLPMTVGTGTERDQAVYVCRTIETLMDKGKQLKDIAVLFRAGYHSFELELELTRRSIPFVKYGGFKFMESAHIRDLLAHLRVIVNKNDILSWGRLLRLLKNIGPGKSQAIIEWMTKGNVSASEVDGWQGGNKDKEGLARLARLMSALSQPHLKPETGLELVVEYYDPILREKFDDFPRRRQELEQLISMSARYKSLKLFLDDLSIEPPTSAADIKVFDEKDFLTLSTIHSAKGLEWGVVFVIWLVDGRFPPGKSFRNEESLEEELRLMYVAATRAKDKLIMVYPEQGLAFNHGGWHNNRQGGLSFFIRGLPDGVISYRSTISNVIFDNDVVLSPKPFKNSFNSNTDSEGLKPGDRVRHPAFGVGVISKFFGLEKVEVIFKDRGLKLLHLGYTNLEKI